MPKATVFILFAPRVCEFKERKLFVWNGEGVCWGEWQSRFAQSRRCCVTEQSWSSFIIIQNVWWRRSKAKTLYQDKTAFKFSNKKNEIRYSACPTFTYIRPQVSLYHCPGTTVIDVILFFFFFLYSRFGLRFFRPLFSFFLSYLLLLKCSPP